MNLDNLTPILTFSMHNNYDETLQEFNDCDLKPNAIVLKFAKGYAEKLDPIMENIFELEHEISKVLGLPHDPMRS